jgi:hypothetical protein
VPPLHKWRAVLPLLAQNSFPAINSCLPTADEAAASIDSQKECCACAILRAELLFIQYNSFLKLQACRFVRRLFGHPHVFSPFRLAAGRRLLDRISVVGSHT